MRAFWCFSRIRPDCFERSDTTIECEIASRHGHAMKTSVVFVSDQAMSTAPGQPFSRNNGQKQSLITAHARERAITSTQFAIRSDGTEIDALPSRPWLTVTSSEAPNLRSIQRIARTPSHSSQQSPFANHTSGSRKRRNSINCLGMPLAFLNNCFRRSDVQFATD
jgi:hypothetical protein